ncbi:MAG: hypothetical protein R3F07_07435 [Opitutaceae bacterium]
MSDHRPNPSLFSQGVSTILVVAAFLIFPIIHHFNDFPGQPTSRPVGSVPPAERAARLSELQANVAETEGSYQWIDQSAGTIRLPIDRAKELTRQKLSGDTQ